MCYHGLQVPTRDFQVAIHLIYEDVGASGYYSNVAFNATIEVVEKPKLVDMEGIFMYLMIAAALGGTGVGGALLGCGLVCCAIGSSNHPAWQLGLACWLAATVIKKTGNSALCSCCSPGLHVCTLTHALPVTVTPAAGYWIFANATDKLGVKKVTKKSKKGDGKAAAFDEDEWIKDTPYAVAQKKKAAATKQA